MSNMKMVALIGDTVREEREKSEERLEQVAMLIADELAKFNNLLAEQKIKIAALRRDVDELMHELKPL